MQGTCHWISFCLDRLHCRQSNSCFCFCFSLCFNWQEECLRIPLFTITFFNREFHSLLEVVLKDFFFQLLEVNFTHYYFLTKSTHQFHSQIPLNNENISFTISTGENDWSCQHVQENWRSFHCFSGKRWISLLNTCHLTIKLTLFIHCYLLHRRPSPLLHWGTIFWPMVVQYFFAHHRICLFENSTFYNDSHCWLVNLPHFLSKLPSMKFWIGLRMMVHWAMRNLWKPLLWHMDLHWFIGIPKWNDFDSRETLRFSEIINIGWEIYSYGEHKKLHHLMYYHTSSCLNRQQNLSFFGG